MASIEITLRSPGGSTTVGRRRFESSDRFYTVAHRKHTKILLCITSANVDRFVRNWRAVLQAWASLGVK